MAKGDIYVELGEGDVIKEGDIMTAHSGMMKCQISRDDRFNKITSRDLMYNSYFRPIVETTLTSTLTHRKITV